MMNEKRVLSLDVLRALAILAVLLLHSAELLNHAPDFIYRIFSFGWIGVDLFFVLSGFLIGRQVFGNARHEERPLKNFLLRRFFRTWPLYYVVLIVYLVFKPLAGFPFNDQPLKFFFFVQNFFEPRDFVQSWSLCIEEQFYILFPLLFFKFNLRNAPAYIWLLPGFASLSYRLVLYLVGVDALNITNAAYNYHFSFLGHLDGIAWGLFLARSFDQWIGLQNKKPFLLSGVILLIGACLYIGPYNTGDRVVLSFQLLALAFSLILVGSYDLKSIPGQKLFHYLAIWSYGIYLWNNLTVKVSLKLFSHNNDLVRFSIFIILTLLISSASYYLIEKPTLKLRDTFLKK